jgi:hypothetical protein
VDALILRFWQTLRGDGNHSVATPDLDTVEAEVTPAEFFWEASSLKGSADISGVGMNTKDPAQTPPAFTRKSETESICMSCFATVKGDRYAPVEEAENIHSDVCLMKPSSPEPYAFF